MGFPVNISFNPATFTPTIDLAGRFAGQLKDAFGSSNVPAATAGMSSGFQPQPLPSFDKVLEQTGGDIDKATKLYGALSSANESNALLSLLNPEYQAQRQQQELERAGTFYKQLGDQMEKYRMTNEIIGNIGQAAKAAFMKYPDPSTLANIYGNVGAAYSQGLEASRGLAQLGAGQPAIKYYNA